MSSPLRPEPFDEPPVEGPAYPFTYSPVADDLGPGQRWSTWDDIGILAGPEPWPDWVITESAAVDTELGVLKTGKEADVFLLERATPDRSVVLAAKRYRSTQHRLFHRDAGYTEGRSCAEAATAGRPSRAPAGGVRSKPASGPEPSSAISPTCGRPACRCPTRCSWTTSRS